MIEITLSDNNSNDNTGQVFAGFAAKTKFLTKYIQQESNIGDKNFLSVLISSSGKYRKLVGDSYLFRPGAINYILSIVERLESLRPNIFFTNEGKSGADAFHWCESIEDFFRTGSYHSTWIGFFGLWDNQINGFDSMMQASNSKLSQTYAACEVAKGNRTLICRENILLSCPVKNRKSYNLAEVFGKQYDGVLRKCLESGDISEDIAQEARGRILREVIFKYYIDSEHDFSSFDVLNDLAKLWGSDYVLKEFATFLKSHLHFNRPTTPATSTSHFASEPKENARTPTINKSNYNLDTLNRFWRQSNSHNATVAGNIFDVSRVSVGRMTYGTLFVKTFGNPREKLKVGSFVSISEGVKFILGGEHRTDCYTTFPFKVVVAGESFEAESKGPIVVEDFVWLGTDSLILSGVRLGTGSVIAAGSVVTKDVPPFAIVGGNPARLIRYRFPDAIVNRLLMLDISTVPLEQILINIDCLYAPISDKPSDLLDRLDSLSSLSK